MNYDQGGDDRIIWGCILKLGEWFFALIGSIMGFSIGFENLGWIGAIVGLFLGWYLGSFVYIVFLAYVLPVLIVILFIGGIIGIIALIIWGLIETLS